MEERFFKKITIRPESMNTDKFSDDTFGKALRRYIDDECIKLIDFAVYVGVNKSTLSRYIKGRYFMAINDNFGHIVGDEVLMTLSDSIRTVFTGGHIYCRVGGDEFMMFVKGTNGMDIIGSLAKKLNAVYSENVKKAAEGLESSLSIGIVLSSSAGKGTEINEMFETLYGLADKALYRTKKNGRNGYSFYEEISE